LKKIIINFVVKVWPAGISPVAPGTICSILASSVGYLININFGSDATLFIGIISGLIGYYFTKIYINSVNKKDPSEVVIDEFSGQMIASSAAGISPLFNIIAFIFFRFFDILKPGIIGKAENIDGALGIMMDDWLAGIFSAAILLSFYILGYIDYNWVLI
tara:strand:+ start:574 stop:1053 length:480 start_codon:yes stop_codon:yes gene_type:complete